jgi:hypothetical protein
VDTTFDLAISFAGSERDYARVIAAVARENGLSVFLDELYESELWGKNLVETLSEIYETKARYCLIVVSKQYCERVFTNVERKAALDWAIRTKTEYILPLVVDGSWIQGLPKSTAYLDLRRKSVIAISEALLKKISGNAPEKLRIPKDIQITRMPAGTLSAEELSQYLIDLCSQSARTGVVAFGCVVYDERTAEIRKLFRDQDYWDALDAASGPSFEIFAIRDERRYEQEVSNTIELLTAASLSRSRSRGYFFSRLLKDYFGEEKTTLAYPSVIIFLVENGSITHCRLIPLAHGTIEEMFLQLRQLFVDLAEAIDLWRAKGGSATDLWNTMKASLLNKNHTIYIQHAPRKTEEAIRSIATFIDSPQTPDLT